MAGAGTGEGHRLDADAAAGQRTRGKAYSRKRRWPARSRWRQPPQRAVVDCPDHLAHEEQAAPPAAQRHLDDNAVCGERDVCDTGAPGSASSRLNATS